jgi:predicted RND superfamily exporter protein
MKHYQLETRWANLVLGHPLLIIVSSILMVIILAYGARYATVSSDYRYFFGEDNPQRTAFESLQNVYSKDDSVLMTVTPRDGQVFKTETLAGLQYLTSESWKLPFVTRVDSITNFQYTHANGDDLVVQDLIRAEDLATNPGNDLLARLKAIALSEPLLKDRLINKQASVTGINIKMTFPGNSPFEVPEAAEAARQLSAQFKQMFPGHEVHLSGMVMLNDAFNEAGIRDVMTLMPIMYLLITVMLFIFIRNVTGVITTLGVVILSIVAGVGFSGWVSIPITPPSSISPTVIMTLAIAHSIHFLKTLLKTMGKGIGKEQAIVESLRQNLRPVFLTSLTTIIGFLSLNFSDTPPFHDLGNITAVGVAVAFLLSIGFLPAIVSLARIKPGKIKNPDNRLAARYSAWLERKSTPISLTMVFVTVVLGMQIGNIRINDQFVGYFDNTIRFRPDSEYTIANLTGVYQLNFDMKSGESQGIADPEYLNHLDRFAQYMRTIPGVVHVTSISDTFKRLNRNMHGDDESYYRLPEQRDLAAQYLLLYEMSLPYGLDLNNQINVSKSSSRVIVTMEEVPTSRILEISALASDWLNHNTPEVMHAEATSPTVMFSHITERNIHAMLWGTLIAFSLITLIMIIALKSVKYGLLSLLPNVIPATLAIGTWSLLVGEAGFSIAFVASVTLGIIVDDTVHFLSKFNYARQTGSNTRESVQYALEHVGGALISTSIILVVGFSVLMLSGFKLNFVLGALSALTIAIALLVDFTLLPAILRLTDKLATAKGGVMKTRYATYTGVIILSALSLSYAFNAHAGTNNQVEKGKLIAVSADEYDRTKGNAATQDKNSRGAKRWRQVTDYI